MYCGIVAMHCGIVVWRESTTHLGVLPCYPPATPMLQPCNQVVIQECKKFKFKQVCYKSTNFFSQIPSGVLEGYTLTAPFLELYYRCTPCNTPEPQVY